MTVKNATDIFGGEATLASKLAQIVEEFGTAELINKGEDPKGILQKFTRQGFLNLLARNNISIDEVMPIKWSSQERDWWIDRMREFNPTIVGVGSSGKPAPEDLILDSFVRWEALRMVCGPNKPSIDQAKEARMKQLRDQLSNIGS